MPPHPTIDPLEPRRLFAATAVPALSSRPAARSTLYLDFTGDATPAWAGTHPGTTPAYDTDGDPSSFSPAELADVRDIFARVADAFSPFNLNVTTVRPKNARRTLTVVIGGAGSWLGGTPEGGVAQIGSFTSRTLPPKVFVFPDQLHAPGPVADAVAHEAGHAFGLAHQSVVNPDTRQITYEYNPGGGATAPLMGQPYAAPHPRWWRGPTSSARTTQDDLAVLTRTLKRAKDDAPNSPATPKRVKWSGSVLITSGVIGTAADTDWYSFTVPSGYVRAQITTPGMLTADAVLLDAKGKVVLRLTDQYSDPPTLLRPGTYRLRIRSNGGYGNVGSYTATVTRVPPTPTALVANPSAQNPSNDIDLMWQSSGPPDVTFRVLRSRDGGSTFAAVATLPAGTTRFTDTGLIPDETYSYQLVATDHGCDSFAARVATRTTPGVKFVAMPAVGVRGQPYSEIHTGDFNGDGKADVYDVDRGVFLGNGDGSFDGPAPGSPPRWSDTALTSFAAATDVNHDGITDLVTFREMGLTSQPGPISRISFALATYYGSHDGTLRPAPLVPLDLLPGTYGYMLSYKDVTGDGLPDVIDAPHSQILIGSPDGSFGSPLPFSLTSGQPTADFNGDGRLDYVSADGFSITVSLTKADGTLYPPLRYDTDPRVNFSDDFVTADFNGDGLADLAICTTSGSTPAIKLLFGTPGGTLTEGSVLPTHNAGELHVADIDGDGAPDLIRVAHEYDPPAPADAYLSHHDGTFSARLPINGPIENERPLSAIADFDGDGRDDIFGTQAILFNRTRIVGGA